MEKELDELLEKYQHYYAISRNEISDRLYSLIIQDLKLLKEKALSENFQ